MEKNETQVEMENVEPQVEQVVADDNTLIQEQIQDGLNISEEKKSKGPNAKDVATKVAAILGAAAIGDMVAPEKAQAQQLHASVGIHTPNVHAQVSINTFGSSRLSERQQIAHINRINRGYRGRTLSGSTLALLMTFDAAIVGARLHTDFIQAHVTVFIGAGFNPRTHIPPQLHRNFRNDFQRNHLTVVNNTTIVNNTTVVNNNNVNQTPPRGSTAPRGTFEEAQREQSSRNSSATQASSRTTSSTQREISEREFSQMSRNSSAAGTQNTGTRNQQQNQTQRSSDRGR